MIEYLHRPGENIEILPKTYSPQSDEKRISVEHDPKYRFKFSPFQSHTTTQTEEHTPQEHINPKAYSTAHIPRHSPSEPNLNTYTKVEQHDPNILFRPNRPDVAISTHQQLSTPSQYQPSQDHHFSEPITSTIPINEPYNPSRNSPIYKIRVRPYRPEDGPPPNQKRPHENDTEDYSVKRARIEPWSKIPNIRHIPDEIPRSHNHLPISSNVNNISPEDEKTQNNIRFEFHDQVQHERPKAITPNIREQLEKNRQAYNKLKNHTFLPRNQQSTSIPQHQPSSSLQRKSSQSSTQDDVIGVLKELPFSESTRSSHAHNQTSDSFNETDGIPSQEKLIDRELLSSAANIPEYARTKERPLTPEQLNQELRRHKSEESSKNHNVDAPYSEHSSETATSEQVNSANINKKIKKSQKGKKNLSQSSVLFRRGMKEQTNLDMLAELPFAQHIPDHADYGNPALPKAPSIRKAPRDIPQKKHKNQRKKKT